MSLERWILPFSWLWCSIGEIAEIVGGGTPPAADESNFDDNGVPWITPADLTGYLDTYISRGRRSLSEKGYASSGARLMPAGTVLFSSRAPIGYCVIASNPVSTNQGFKSLVLGNGMAPEFVRYYLLASKAYAESLASGTTFKELSGTRMSELRIPMAPKNEQTRIVSRLDNLFARLKRSRSELERIPGLVERAKQEVLRKAVSGELTQAWRETRGVGQPEKASLGEVASDFAYGSSAKSQESGEVPVLRMGNIQDGTLDWNNLVYTSDPVEIEKYQLEPGDVLFNRTNSPALVGKTAIYRGERKAIFAGYLIRVRCKPNLLPAFLTYCLNSPIGREYAWRVKSDAVSQSNINAKKLASFTFNLPTVSEQEEIVRRVDVAFSYLARLSTESNRASALLDRLEQTTLEKAFRGELVPQDPDDEPASVLLERIREAKVAQTSEPKPARTRSRTMTKLTADSLKEKISELPNDRFSFGELRNSIGGDYETLRETLFQLLDETRPVVHQVFDEEAKEICFVRVRQ